MSDTYEDIMYDMAMEEEYREKYEAELIDKAIAELPIDNIRFYLGTYGDAIEARVKKCLDQANQLIKDKNFGSALVISVTGIEIIFRFFILRPLVEGAFLSDELAGILIQRILPGQTARDRELLPMITKHWNIPLTDLKLSNDKKLWHTLRSEMLPKRNAVVHKADDVEEKYPLCAIECASVLLKEVVVPMAKNFGLTWPETGVWHKIDHRTETGGGTTIYTPSSPFK
ncbi:MAG: hypothetical protein JRF50_13625 [Deltaproteobacteria bacterium]|nr:hypothetical protein [Deltaproteobacteria bacterium]